MTTRNATKSLPLQLEITHAFQGPNIWSRLPVLVVHLDVAGFSFTHWDLADELLTSLELKPVGTTERCPVNALADWFSAAAIQLQMAAGSPVSFRQWSVSDDCHRIDIAIQFEEEELARAVVDALRGWLDAMVRGEPIAASDDWSRLREFAYTIRLGNTTGAIVAAASARGIPFLRLDRESLVQLGHGRNQRRIRGATTDRTSAIAISIATDKQLAKQLLDKGGIPVPNGQLVTDVEDACRAASEIGWPVVVKPCDADYGDGVSIRLTSAEEVREAFTYAQGFSQEVLVESYVPGNLFRLLVVDNRLVAAVRREAPYVIGDGQRTIRELVEEANHDPYRDERFPSPSQTLSATTGNVEPFARDGRSNDTIVEPGRTIALRRDIFLRSGGTQVDRTAHVHPAIAKLATDATRIMGLDIAGLDVLASDISQAPDEQDIVVLEVNPEPAINLHMSPLCEPARPIGDAIVESLFPKQQTGCIPLIAVLGSTADMEVARRIAAETVRDDECVGLASRDGAWLLEQKNGEPKIRQLGPSCDRLGEHTRRLWLHPRMGLAIVHLTVDDILREGVPFYDCDRFFEMEPIAKHSEALQRDLSDRQRALACLRATLKRDQHPTTRGPIDRSPPEKSPTMPTH